MDDPMTSRIEDRLAELGISLPEPPAPVAAYIPYRRHGNSVYVSGQLPVSDGHTIIGKLGAGLDVAAGAAAARICAINLLAQIRQACGGNLGAVTGLVKLTGFVNSTPDFADHPAVINGASELLAEVMGEAGRHSRSAVGVSSLPFGAPVEIEAIFSVR